MASWRLGVRSLGVRALGVAAALSVTIAAHPSADARGGLRAADGQAPLEFDVVSLKANADGTSQIGQSPDEATGQFRYHHISLRSLILRAYPVETSPAELVNLPEWAEGYFDFEAKARPRTTPDERQQMFRAMLSDRVKLRTHYESRERPAYDLVFARADKRLGPGITPSALDCRGGDAPRASLPLNASFQALRAATLDQCGGMIRAEALEAGGVTMARLARMLANDAERPVVDRTGLTGYYAITLRYRSALRPDDPDERPALMTALSEQLGFKLEPSKTLAQVLVIDHIERPAEN